MPLQNISFHRSFFLRSLAITAVAAAVAGCGTKSDDLLCGDDGCFFTEQEWQRIQKLAALPDPPLDPSNHLIGNDDAVQLGWRLYFERELSGNATWVDTLGRTTSSARAPLGMPLQISCASCHNPAHAGADTSSVPGHVSVGAGWYDVNGQQTVNAAYYKLLYWNGRSDSLWGQAAAVMESRVSMNGNRLAIVQTVAAKYRDSYDALFPDDPLPAAGAMLPAAGKPGKAGCMPEDTTEPFGDAFDCLPDADRAAVTKAFINVAKLIGAYEYELRSRNAPFDKFVAEGPKSTSISDGARRGLKLFVGRASCIDCHNTAFFSDNKFHDIGVPQEGPGVPTETDCPSGSPVCDCVQGVSCLPWGYYDGLTKLKASTLRRDGAFSDDKESADSSLYQATPSAEMKGAWRTPSLRDVALTAPYMHDGVYRTLEDVIWHYNVGGSVGVAAGHKAPELHPLFLSDGDRDDLVQFLLTLTGTPDRPELHVPPTGGKL